MSSNKSVKQKLIQKYGGIDFLDQLKIKIPQSKHFKSNGLKKQMRQLTYHHILEKSKGGKATVENGALLTAEHHAWFHQQPAEIQARLNTAFRDFKRQKDQELEIIFEEDIESPFEISLINFSIDKTGKINIYNRAKMKEETRKLIKEDLEEK